MIDPKRFSLHLGAFSVVAAAFFVFLLSHSLYSWMIIPVFCSLAILIGNPPALLWYGMSWFMMTQYAQTELRVGFFNYFDEFVTVGMLALLILQSRGISSAFPKRLAAARPLTAIALFSLVLTLLSAVVNKSIDIFLVMWCFQYLRMFVVFFFTVRFAREVDLRLFFRFIAAFSILQFILNLGWKLQINPLPNNRGTWASDFGIGTFSACDQVAYFCVMVIVLCLAIIIDPPSKKVAKRAMWVLLITFINFMLTNTIHAFFLLIPAVGLFFVLNYRVIMKVVSWPELMSVFIGISLIFFFLVAFTDAGKALRPDYILSRYESFLNEPKMIAYRRSINELPQESDFFWFTGHGPGQAGSSIGRALGRPIANKYFNTIYNEQQFRDEAIAGSISSGEQTGYLTYWSEIGPLGLLMILGSYFLVLHKTRIRLRKGDISNKFHLAIARSFPSVVLVVLLVSFIRDMFYIAWFVGVCWVWAALAVTPIENRPKKAGLEI